MSVTSKLIGKKVLESIAGFTLVGAAVVCTGVIVGKLTKTTKNNITDIKELIKNKGGVKK